jgi:putative transposase
MAEQDKGVEELLDRLLEGRKPEELVGAGGLLEDLTKRLYERALEGELTAHLGYEKHAPEGRNRGNSRNGKSTKRLKTETGELALEIPGTGKAASIRCWCRRGSGGSRASTRR